MSKRRKKDLVKRRLRRKLKNQPSPKTAPQLLEGLANMERFPREMVFVEPKGEERMSEILLDFAEPLLGMCESFQDYRVAVDIAALAWNVAVLPRDEGRRLFDEAIKSLPDGDGKTRRFMMVGVQTLVERKRRLYGHIDRFIGDYYLADAPDGPHLSVKSLFMDEEAQRRVLAHNRPHSEPPR